MAGNYPDVPSWRMAIDRDGTVGVHTATGATITQLPSTEMVKVNDEDFATDVSVAAIIGGGYVAFVFPEKRDLDGFYHHWIANAGSCLAEVSTNTTNGWDGTWTQIASGIPSAEGGALGWRTSIHSVTALAIRGVRFKHTITSGGLTYRGTHLFGEVAPGENVDRLALWHPTLDQRITPAYFDWGDVPRSSSADKQFRVKNLSPTQTGNSVRVAMDVLTDTIPSVPGQHSLSTDGSTFLAQVNVGALAPGAISGVVTLRRVTPSNASFGAWAMRVFAEADSWS